MTLQDLQQLLNGVVPAAPQAIATLIAAALTACATVLGTFLVVFFGWLKERGDNTRRSVLIKEATDQCAFWMQWYQAQNLACPPNDADNLRLKIKEELDAVANELRRGIVRPAKPNSLIQRFFLLYGASSYLVWLPRILFYYLAMEICFDREGDILALYDYRRHKSAQRRHPATLYRSQA